MNNFETIYVTKVAWKEGQGKFGMWKKIGILCNEYERKWISHFIRRNDDLTAYETIAEGMKIRVRVEKEVKDGTEYLNFFLPSRLDLLEERVSELETLLKKPETKDDLPF